MPATPIHRSFALAPNAFGRPPAVEAAEARHAHFLALLAGYRGAGGLATGPDIAAGRRRGALAPLAGAIAARQVISLDWGGQRWLPVFQFVAGELAVRPPVQVLIAELSGALDDWELCDWFVQPNAWLRGAAPWEILNKDFARAHDAARALHFICSN